MMVNLTAYFRPSCLLGLFAAASLSAEENSDEPETTGETLTPVVMQFDWLFNAQFAGFYQAIEQGFFENAGLSVELRGQATTPDTIAMTLSEPKISFGSAESNVLMADAATGADLKIIGAMFQDSPMGWMFVDDGTIQEFTDLATKRVGTHADGSRVIRLLLEEAGADTANMETYDCGYDPAIVIEGEADAMQCYYIDEFVRLEQLVGDKAGIFLAKDHGYRAYSQVMFTAAETVESHPAVVAVFLEAVKRGWQHAFDHPEETVDLILAEYNPELDREYQLRSLEKIEELMIPEDGALLRPADPGVFEAGLIRMVNLGLIESELDVSDLLAQEFLPGNAEE